MARLTEEQKEEIRRRYLAGETTRQLGDAFGVSSPAISKITRGTKETLSVAKEIAPIVKKQRDLEEEKQKSLQKLASPSLQNEAQTLAEKLVVLSDVVADASLSGARVAKEIYKALEKEAEKGIDKEFFRTARSGAEAAKAAINPALETMKVVLPTAQQEKQQDTGVMLVTEVKDSSEEWQAEGLKQVQHGGEANG